MSEAQRAARITSLVEDYLHLGHAAPALDVYLSTVDAEVRDEVEARCRDAAFIDGFFAKLPAMRVLPPLPTEIGGCRLGELLGEGAMGKVFRATQIELGREVAVKLVRDEAAHDERLLGRLRDESRALAALDHPGIVKVLFCGETGGWLWFVMEFVAGRSLAEQLPALLRQLGTDGPRRFDRVARIVAEVLDALAYAHGQGIVNRDLKPSNVMLDGDGRVKLVDFGLAKGADSAQRTLPGQLVGTPAFLCPEVVARRAHERFAPDLWAVGAMLFQLLTGRLPYGGGDTEAVLAALLRPVAVDPQRVRPDVPKPLAAICARALAPDPADRYPSAVSFAADLRRFLAGEPIERAQPLPFARVMRHLRRNRRAYVLGAAALVTTVVSWRLAVSYTRNEALRVQVQNALALRDPKAAESHVLATHAAQARQLLENDAIAPTDRLHLQQLLRSLTDEAEGRFARATAKVEQGMGSSVDAPLHAYRAPALALVFQGLAEASGAARIESTLPNELAVATQSFPQFVVEPDESKLPADVRIEAIDILTGAALTTVGTGTTPFRVHVPPGTYRVVVSRGDAFAEITKTALAPGERVIRPRLLPTSHVTAGMVPVRAGTARVGMDSRLPTVFAARTIEHAAFFIDRVEVTCREFRAFVLATEEPPPSTWGGQYDPAWGAGRYAAWVGKRLPTWLEWQVAARGPTGFLYPWGDTPPPAKRFVLGSDAAWHLGVRPVGTTPEDVSWCGALDMYANVDEWTDTPYIGLFENQPLPVFSWRLCGGFAWCSKSPQPTLDVIRPGQPEWFSTGFRCAKSLAP
jgi:formylglycine-generating enzyme required for sulfatase activity/tRNA A-37 threonylcarbamoyl transferase component Bud32